MNISELYDTYRMREAAVSGSGAFTLSECAC